MTQALEKPKAKPETQDGNVSVMEAKQRKRIRQGIAEVEEDSTQEAVILTVVKVRVDPKSGRMRITHRTRLIVGDAEAVDSDDLTAGQMTLPNFALVGLEHEAKHGWEPQN